MAWVQRYEERGYVDIDPVAKRVIDSVLPFCWNEILLALPVNAPERAIFTEAKEFGLAMGADIPLHEPGFGAGSFSVFSSDETGFARAWNRYRHLLHVIAVPFHECHKVLHPDPALKPSLTKRERECLAWLARGKTAWEIGEILGVTENTTRMYLNSAMKKLGANSRLQAVVKAMLTRQILP
jgi:DNA-binding CsgD family transcriptional regulator